MQLHPNMTKEEYTEYYRRLNSPMINDNNEIVPCLCGNVFYTGWKFVFKNREEKSLGQFLDERQDKI